jgi:hypothetical protein
MQLRIVLVACLSSAIAYPSLNDWFASDREIPNSSDDVSNGPPIADAGGASQAPADDIWTGSESNLLAYDAGVGYILYLDCIPSKDLTKIAF